MRVSLSAIQEIPLRIDLAQPYPVLAIMARRGGGRVPRWQSGCGWTGRSRNSPAHPSLCRPLPASQSAPLCGAEPALSALFFSTGFLAFLKRLSNLRKPRDGFGYVAFRGCTICSEGSRQYRRCFRQPRRCLRPSLIDVILAIYEGSLGRSHRPAG